MGASCANSRAWEVTRNTASSVGEYASNKYNSATEYMAPRML